MITVDSLSKTYTVHEKEPGLLGSIRSLVRRKHVHKHAVKNVSFSVGEGEIVGLIGANGAGKTTLVKMLAGIIHPTKGNASVLGHTPWERHNEFRQRIALIMGQKASLWWDLPAADCFLLLREVYRIPPKQHQETLAYLTEVLGVEKQLKIQIRRLSLGERMKMELVAALLHNPRVVYLDEPTIGLDLTAQRSIRDFLLAYRREHQPAMLLTSHYMEDIERLCKRIIILREGEIVYDGSLQNVVESYAQTKTVTAHLRKTGDAIEPKHAVVALGEIIEINDLTVRVQVPRNEVARAATAVLESYPVLDLTIEEPEIGTIIEGIMRDTTS